MNQMSQRNGLKIAPALEKFVETEALPGTGLDSQKFWADFSAIVHDLAPQNRTLIAERNRLQQELDNWHSANPGPIRDMKGYRAFLESIRYIVPAPATVRATTQDVDTEISEQAGPQLFVPLSNPRYALNAANARWGSLYDALYGTDAIPETAGAEHGASFNPKDNEVLLSNAKQNAFSALSLYIIDQQQIMKTGKTGRSTSCAPC